MTMSVTHQWFAFGYIAGALIEACRWLEVGPIGSIAGFVVAIGVIGRLGPFWGGFSGID